MVKEYECTITFIIELIRIYNNNLYTFFIKPYTYTFPILNHRILIKNFM